MAKTIRAWAVVNRRGIVRMYFDFAMNARRFADDCNISVLGPQAFVVPLTGTFTLKPRTRPRRRSSK